RASEWSPQSGRCQPFGTRRFAVRMRQERFGPSPLNTRGATHPAGGLCPPGECGLITMTPKRCQDQAWLHQPEALGAREPVLFICEDLHWIAPCPRELFDRTIKREPARIARRDPPRPEFVPPWGRLPQVTTVPLGPARPKCVSPRNEAANHHTHTSV